MFLRELLEVKRQPTLANGPASSHKVSYPGGTRSSVGLRGVRPGDPRPTTPGVIAVQGVGTVADDEYTITAQSMAAPPPPRQRSMLPVTARLVSNDEEEYEAMQEQLQRQLKELEAQREELRQIRRHIPQDNVCFAQVISGDEDDHEHVDGGGDEPPGVGRVSSNQGPTCHFGVMGMLIVAALVILAIVGAVLGVLFSVVVGIDTGGIESGTSTCTNSDTFSDSGGSSPDTKTDTGANILRNIL